MPEEKYSDVNLQLFVLRRVLHSLLLCYVEKPRGIIMMMSAVYTETDRRRESANLFCNAVVYSKHTTRGAQVKYIRIACSSLKLPGFGSEGIKDYAECNQNVE